MLSIFAISSSLHQGTDVDSPDSFIEGLDFEYSFKGSEGVNGFIAGGVVDDGGGDCLVA